MKKVSFLQVSAVVLMFFAVGMTAHADTVAIPVQTQTALSASADTGDAPAILPTNPFYFAKEFVRGVRLFFTFGKVNKAAYELQVADQKALEVKEIEKLNPENTDAIKKALDNYQSDVTGLKTRIESLSATSTDPAVGQLLNDLTDQAVRHAELFQNLKSNDAIKASVDQAESTVTDTVSAAATKLDTPQAAQVRIQKVMQADIATPSSTIDATAGITTEATKTLLPLKDIQVQSDGTNMLDVQAAPVELAAPAVQQ